ncbi:MAG: gamma-glutamyltransferase family protein [Rhodospirillales bacterium]|nr:gamma-glutamyltransferase family protein [Rhodospirillales bacterium]
MTAAFPPRPSRTNVMATRHVVSAGHYLAAHAGFMVLEAGGNAVDAGVTTGIALNVLESQMCCFSGVAPTIVYIAETNEVVTIDGLGGWPQAASCEYFIERGHKVVPEGILQTVIPAACDAWVTLLERWGTISFADAAQAAIRFARDGFPMHPQMSARVKEQEIDFRGIPQNEAIYLPGGRAPEPGEIFFQKDLGKTLQFLVDEEKKAVATGGRRAGLEAVRRAFYRGDIAQTIVKFHKENGGLLSADDMANYRVRAEPAPMVKFRDVEVYGCGPWCQGPMLLQEMTLLNGIDLEAMGHNTTSYIHTVTEAVKLAAADREAYYGDPLFVDVPLDTLLSTEYADQRRKLIRPDAAWPQMPKAGEVEIGGVRRTGSTSRVPATALRQVPGLDTTYACVIDRHGNAFSTTPSDGVMRRSPIIPGTGLCPSGRGNQSRVDPKHPASIQPGKRPRLTPNPAFALRPGKMVMPFGTPGGDEQTQAMLQSFLNMVVFGADPQTAIEAPRFASCSFPNSFSPHTDRPGVLRLEPEISKTVAKELAAKGHTIEWIDPAEWPQAGMCAIQKDVKQGVIWGAADRRRTGYAVGW